MAFTFTSDIETGNRKIDQEHKELIGKINDLLAACGSGKGRAEIANTINFLKSYTRTHFSNEEQLQKAANYPLYAEHKKYHTTFIATVDDIAKRLDKEGPTIQLVGEINQKIGSWLVMHIKTEDKKLAKFLAEQK
ncbi:MAG: hemerythrin family protein [Bacillota bacterium]